MYAGRHRRAIARATRRKLVWADTRLGVTNVAAAGVNATDLFSAYRLAGGSTQGGTIARVIIRGTIAATVATNPWDGFDVGVIVHPTAGIGSVNPSSDPYEDWMLNERYPTWTGSGGCNVYGAATPAEVVSQFFIDLKSQRKMEELGQSLHLCVQNTTAFAYGYAFHARVLLRLP
jgi:hypothetical protein